MFAFDNHVIASFSVILGVRVEGRRGGVAAMYPAPDEESLVVSITDSAVGMIRVKGTRTAARTSSACSPPLALCHHIAIHTLQLQPAIPSWKVCLTRLNSALHANHAARMWYAS